MNRKRLYYAVVLLLASTVFLQCHDIELVSNATIPSVEGSVMEESFTPRGCYDPSQCVEQVLPEEERLSLQRFADSVYDAYIESIKGDGVSLSKTTVSGDFALGAEKDIYNSNLFSLSNIQFNEIKSSIVGKDWGKLEHNPHVRFVVKFDNNGTSITVAMMKTDQSVFSNDTRLFLRLGSAECGLCLGSENTTNTGEGEYAMFYGEETKCKALNIKFNHYYKKLCICPYLQQQNKEYFGAPIYIERKDMANTYNGIVQYGDPKLGFGVTDYFLTEYMKTVFGIPIPEIVTMVSPDNHYSSFENIVDYSGRIQKLGLGNMPRPSDIIKGKGPNGDIKYAIVTEVNHINNTIYVYSETEELLVLTKNSNGMYVIKFKDKKYTATQILRPTNVNIINPFDKKFIVNIGEPEENAKSANGKLSVKQYTVSVTNANKDDYDITVKLSSDDVDVKCLDKGKNMYEFSSEKAGKYTVTFVITPKNSGFRETTIVQSFEIGKITYKPSIEITMDPNYTNFQQNQKVVFTFMPQFDVEWIKYRIIGSDGEFKTPQRRSVSGKVFAEYEDSFGNTAAKKYTLEVQACPKNWEQFGYKVIHQGYIDTSVSWTVISNEKPEYKLEIIDKETNKRRAVVMSSLEVQGNVKWSVEAQDGTVYESGENSLTYDKNSNIYKFEKNLGDYNLPGSTKFKVKFPDGKDMEDSWCNYVNPGITLAFNREPEKDGSYKYYNGETVEIWPSVTPKDLGQISYVLDDGSEVVVTSKFSHKVEGGNEYGNLRKIVFKYTGKQCETDFVSISQPKIWKEYVPKKTNKLIIRPNVIFPYDLKDGKLTLSGTVEYPYKVGVSKFTIGYSKTGYGWNYKLFDADESGISSYKIETTIDDWGFNTDGVVEMKVNYDGKTDEKEAEISKVSSSNFSKIIYIKDENGNYLESGNKIEQDKRLDVVLSKQGSYGWFVLSTKMAGDVIYNKCYSTFDKRLNELGDEYGNMKHWVDKYLEFGEKCLYEHPLEAMRQTISGDAVKAIEGLGGENRYTFQLDCNDIGTMTIKVAFWNYLGVVYYDSFILNVVGPKDSDASGGSSSGSGSGSSSGSSSGGSSSGSGSGSSSGGSSSGGDVTKVPDYGGNALNYHKEKGNLGDLSGLNTILYPNLSLKDSRPEAYYTGNGLGYFAKSDCGKFTSDGMVLIYKADDFTKLHGLNAVFYAKFKANEQKIIEYEIPKEYLKKGAKFYFITRNYIGERYDNGEPIPDKKNTYKTNNKDGYTHTGYIWGPLILK